MPKTLRSPRHEALRVLLVKKRKEAGLTQAKWPKSSEDISHSSQWSRADNDAWMWSSSWTLRRRLALTLVWQLRN